MKKLECILLIDDNVNDNYYHFLTVRELISTKQIKTVRDGKEALLFLQQGIQFPLQHSFPDLIFLDINMPGMDGFEFLKEIKLQNLFGVNRPVVIIMTNFLNEEEERRATENFAGEIVAFTSKPLTKSALSGIIEKYFK